MSKTGILTETLGGRFGEEAKAFVQAVKELWPGWIQATESEDELLRRFPDPMLRIAWHQSQKIAQQAATATLTEAEMLAGSQWRDLLLEFAADQMLRWESIQPNR